ncbi:MULTISPECIES: flagellar hook-length control protein FliK [Burkholderia]|uniref:Flagellar hook-length control protein FliK n=1 Tax=Burkholderia contaminans TaxID=488447 RepID=A0A2S5E507_9BURK|nr:MULTISPECIES: flagellar hook-length control protein FliK [Burkholderia]EKS9794153.1 flagellar hook-length control protein FliK [Burkholderia cepacia]EKS9802101.1 flagellar hook-length control protein FliK [Burkholderia cepacia]EKS9810702.1 flagellar hook-length control protein FliK [Burkholderia cepacia]EKS9816404.1 flagellar hook-length control protein FliK [Burkholderia cepacia]EKS9827069.1 flagellar hook-length control protein FliK [Burkholderia cepacia]
MTESVSSPRFRSNRSSARSRPRSAAAAGSTSARATVRSGSAPAGDASRDERTLDLFGDPVLEPGERVPAAARDEAGAQAEAAIDVADDVASGRQAALDGFSAPDGVAAAGHVEAAEGAVTPGDATVAHGVSSPEGRGDANVDVAPASGAAAMKAVDISLGDGVATKAADGPAGDGAATAATKLQADEGAEVKATGSQAADGEVEKAVAAAAVKSREGRSSGDAVKERRASSGGKRRAAAGAGDATTEQSAPIVTSVGTAAEAAGASPVSDTVTTVEPQTSAQPAKPVIAANTANTANTADAAKAHDAAPRADVTVSPVTQPLASAASFVTKPSAERTQPPAPAFDPDTHLRPLTDRLAALQADVDGLTRTADREMRRVNRLLLALAVVVLAGLIALVMQTRQIAHLKQDVATKQQRIDRLAADLSTQQATLMTLEEHHEALLSQVDRLQRNANREAAVAKRARRTR